MSALGFTDYDLWKTTPPDYWDDDEPEDDGEDEREEMVLDCGYEGCCMPEYHFRSECHNAEDVRAYYAELERTSGGAYPP